MSRRSALAGLVGAAAAAPAAVHALNEHNAMRHARELAAINDYNVRMQNVFGVANVRSMPPPPIVTTYANPQSVVVTSPFHSLGHTSFLNVPGAQLPNGVTAGDVIKFQGKDWLVLDGGRNPVTGEYSLQARAV